MRKLIVLALTVFVLGACGDDDGGSGGLSSEEQEYVDAAMEGFDPADAEPLTEDDARCVVESMVGSMGVDRLEELGVQPEDFGSESEDPFPEGLEEDEATEVVDGIDGCFDLGALMIEGIAAGQDLADEDRECLEDAFDKETMRSLFITILTEGEQAIEQDPELLSELLSAASKCPGLLGS